MGHIQRWFSDVAVDLRNIQLLCMHAHTKQTKLQSIRLPCPGAAQCSVIEQVTER